LKPLAALGRAEAAGLSGLLFDLDDTFLDDGRLTETAYAALGRLSRAGLTLVAVTGRPAGFGEVLARQWPVRGVVTENGAVAFHRGGGRLERWERADEATRRARRIRIAGAFDELRRRFAEVRPSDDVHARISDLTIDIGESQRVPPDVVLRIESAARDLGMRTFVSSVHLHLTLDPFDKASGTVAFLFDCFGEDPTAVRRRYAYVGDSSNDGPCFFAFATSFGVANIAASVPNLSVPPSFVAPSPKGKGFAQIADRILELRV
jgi:hydroxymethylpyrimidine pyrophosphatase-like HAD family hydrolase